MKLALFTDIHSTHAAPEAGLGEAFQRKVDGVVFLGSYVSDCPYPQKTMELLYQCWEKCRCWFIRGKREEYLLAYHRGCVADLDGKRVAG